MKKLLAKIRNKKLKGNVSLLVIFVLLASSVISLLSINQIQRLLTYGNMTFNYFRAFYMAKAWTELWLTEVYNSGDGFNHEVLSGSAIVTWNLLSGYEWFEPYFNMTITWSFATWTNDIRNSKCNDENKIRLTSWAWIMLSLFSDDTGKRWNLSNILSEDDKKITNLNNFTKLSLSNNSELTFAFFTYNKSGYMTNIVVSTWTDLWNFLEKQKIDKEDKWYLTIKNPGTWDEVAEFCITMGGDLIPYSDSLITVFWHYGDMEVWIQSVVKKWVPDWTLNVIDDD